MHCNPLDFHSVPQRDLNPCYPLERVFEKFFDDVKHEYPDWAITGLFYAALHLMEAFLAVKGIMLKIIKKE